MPQQQPNEEQLKALQEKIKQMSPEELKEFQKKQCIFCQIITGKVQSRKIYEDEHVIAILDVNPANPGHILLMPKEHYSIMPQIPSDEIGHIFIAAKALSNASLKALEVQGSNIIVANGVVAGQRAQHFMVHLIPRKENDDISLQLPQKTIPEDELQKIKYALSESLGMKREEKEEAAHIPLAPREKKVVEAEFKEKPKERASKSKPIKKQVKDDKENDGENANLDDIARLLGAK